MTENIQSESQPAKPYKPWVGVLLSFIISGAAQFLSGNIKGGLKWFTVLLLLVISSFWLLTSSIIRDVFWAYDFFSAFLIVWIAMLTKSYRPLPRLSRRGWLLFVLLAVGLNALTNAGMGLCFQTFKLSTGSMSPTLRGDTKQPDGSRSGGDHFIVEKYVYWLGKPQRGDIVAFKTAGLSPFPFLPKDEIFLKRIVGIPGDVLSIQAGHLANHGQLLSEPAILAELVVTNPITTMQNNLAVSNDSVAIPEGQYFVLGDNTSNSLDSRYFGTVPEASIIGKVSKIYWPLSRAGMIQ